MPMSDYGTHPTQYSNLSNDDLYSMYRESVFTNLTDNQKLDLLQETVNRDAEERGMVGAPKVTFAELPSDISGQAKDGIIQINQEMVLNGTQTFTYEGQVYTNAIPDHNCQALNTAIHENIHCWQDQINDGTIQIDDAEKTAEYAANDFTATAVCTNGSYKLGSQYLTGKTSYFCYYFQSTERDAYKGAEEKTGSILKAISEKFGTEKSFQAHEQHVQLNGYKANEEKANTFYQNPNFEKDLNQTLRNQYFGTKVQVDPQTERAVKNEMAESYKELTSNVKNEVNHNAREENEMGGKGMGLHGPVSLDNYNNSLDNNEQDLSAEEQRMGEEVSAENESDVSTELAGDDLGGDDLDGGDDDLDV